MSSQQNAATPYGPGWHHHNAGRLHHNDGCSVCSERARAEDARR